MSLVKKNEVGKSFNHHVDKVFVVLITTRVCRIGLRKNTIGYIYIASAASLLSAITSARMAIKLPFAVSASMAASEYM